MNTIKMIAAVCERYGTPEVVSLKSVAKPIQKNNEILVKIIAAPINSGDVRVRGLVAKGFMKIIMQLAIGFFRPRKPILGTVFSGTVEAIGKDVSMFKVGDKVFGTTGFKFGTHAEYIAVAENSVVLKKPLNATFEAAAALPFGGQTALYFLRKAKIARQVPAEILIIGGTGAVGTAAIQIAKFYSSTVTVVCSDEGSELAKRLGADELIIYNKENFLDFGPKFDIIFDAVGKTTKKQCLPLLNKGGRYLTVGGFDVASEKKEQLIFLSELFEKEKYVAVIDSIFPLSHIVEAHQYVDKGRKKGNVILYMNS